MEMSGSSFDLNVESPLHTSDKPCIKYSNLAQCALFASIVNDVETSIPLKGSHFYQQYRCTEKAMAQTHLEH